MPRIYNLKEGEEYVIPYKSEKVYLHTLAVDKKEGGIVERSILIGNYFISNSLIFKLESLPEVDLTSYLNDINNLGYIANYSWTTEILERAFQLFSKTKSGESLIPVCLVGHAHFRYPLYILRSLTDCLYNCFINPKYADALATEYGAENIEFYRTNILTKEKLDSIIVVEHSKTGEKIGLIAPITVSEQQYKDIMQQVDWFIEKRKEVKTSSQVAYV